MRMTIPSGGDGSRDYFWIAATDGRSRQHTAGGTTREVTYAAGDSMNSP
jgi:hypothetical protein